MSVTPAETAPVPLNERTLSSVTPSVSAASLPGPIHVDAVIRKHFKGRAQIAEDQEREIWNLSMGGRERATAKHDGTPIDSPAERTSSGES